MMRPIHRLLMLLGLVALGLQGCGDTGTGLRDPHSNPDALHPDSTGKRSIADFKAAIDARKLAGDTTLTDVQKLRAVLTDSITGYRLEIDLADTLKMPLSSMVEAKKVFYNQEGGYIELAIGDYVGDPEFMLVSLHRHNVADSVEVQGILEERTSAPGLWPAQAKDAFAWTAWNSARRSASVYVGLDQRYFLTVEATPHDGPFDLKEVAGWLRWDGIYGGK